MIEDEAENTDFGLCHSTTTTTGKYLVIIEQLLGLGVDFDDEFLVADFPVVKKADAPHRRFRVFVLAKPKRLERKGRLCGT